MITIASLIYAVLIVGVIYGVWHLSRIVLREKMKKELIRILELLVKKIDANVAGADDLKDTFTSMIAIIIGKSPEAYTKQMNQDFEKFKKHMGDHYKSEPPQPTPRKWG